MGREAVSACSSKCAESGRSRQQVGDSGRTDVFWDGAGPSRSSFAGGGGGSGPDGVRSGHSWGGGRAARRAGQAGRPCHTTQRVDRQRARRIAQMSRGCRSLRTASNRMVCAVHAGEDGGLADVHSVPSLALNDHPQRRNHPSPSCGITVFSAVPMCYRTFFDKKNKKKSGCTLVPPKTQLSHSSGSGVSVLG